MILKFTDGEYASQDGYGQNGVQLFTVSWITGGAGLTVRSSLPGIRQQSIPTTDYQAARERCRQILALWLSRVAGVEAEVTVDYEKDAGKE